MTAYGENPMATVMHAHVAGPCILDARGVSRDRERCKRTPAGHAILGEKAANLDLLPERSEKIRKNR